MSYPNREANRYFMNDDERRRYLDEASKANEDIRQYVGDTALSEEPTVGYPFQQGDFKGTGLVVEQGSNKASIPGFAVYKKFNLVPLTAEAGVFEPELVSAGFTGAFAARANNWSWYGATRDDQNFYYQVNGGPSFFSSLFGFGTNSIFVCRKLSDTSLVWVRDCKQYSLMLPNSLNVVGSPLRPGRTSLAIHGDALYSTGALTNLGPELYKINKSNGLRVWTMLFDVPTVAGGGVRVSPAQNFGTQDGSLYGGSNYILPDQNIVVKEIIPGIPSIFLGTSSYQNAINLDTVYNTMTDQGCLSRIDDLGATGSLVWKTRTCAPILQVGDVITAGGDPLKDPFRPAQLEVLIWRSSTDGRFADAGGVTGKVLDFATYPGYRPKGYPVATNDNTMPVQQGRLVTAAQLPLTEASFASIFRTPAPGIGGLVRVYQHYQGAPTVAKTITDVLIDLNANLPLLPGFAANGAIVFLFAYLSAAERAAVDGAAAPFLADNVAVRYVGSLPSGYTIANAQEANALNYYGNSIWGPQSTILIEDNMIMCGTAQSHGMPLDEVLFYQAPAFDFRDLAQPVVDAMYRYTQNDAALAGLGPYSTLTALNTAKENFANTQTSNSLQNTDKSPRGRRSYSDSILALDLDTGAMLFGVRTLASDIANFGQNPPIVKEIFLVGPDADVSSGIQVYKNVKKADGSVGKFFATNNKGSLICYVEYSGFNRTVPWDHTDIPRQGLIVKHFYGGALSALGGSNYGACQSGSQSLVYTAHNFSTDVAGFDIPGSGVRSNTYQANNFGGWEFHVTQDGRVYQIRDSILGSFNLGTGKVEWEVALGNCDFCYPACYNDVIMLCQSQGIFKGFDAKSGKQIWAIDAKADKLGGVNPPHFKNGLGVAVCQYRNGPGNIGNTGYLLRVAPEKLIAPMLTLSDLFANYQFVSFDVNPKKAPVSLSTDNLIEPEAITHNWSNGTLCSATHTPDGGLPQTITVTAAVFDPLSKIVTFVDANVVTSVLRYLSIRMLNSDTYILSFQRMMAGKWVNHEATFKTTSIIDHSKVLNALY